MKQIAIISVASLALLAPIGWLLWDVLAGGPLAASGAR